MIKKDRKQSNGITDRKNYHQTEKKNPFILRIVLLMITSCFLITFSGCIPIEDEPETYSISFKANYIGGEDFTTTILSTQKLVEKVPSMNREGYDFKGWFRNELGSGPEINIYQTINSNLILYAKWEQQNYSINLITNIPNMENVSLLIPKNTPASDVIPPMNRYGYQFIGWYNDRNQTEQVDTSQLINISKTLYAGWVDVHTDYYVAMDGSDENDGSITHPFKTFQKAINVMTPGDSMVVFGGTYHEQLFINKKGTEDAWFHLKVYGEEIVIIDGNGFANNPNDGLWYGMVRITDASYISIEGFQVINSYGSAIFTADSHHINVINNHTINSQNPGIFAWYVDDLLIDGNEVESACMHPDSGLEDISLRFNKRVIIKNNYVHDSDNIGIDAAGGVQDAQIYNNLVERTGLGFYVDSWDGDLFNVSIYNNISRYNNVGLCVNTENGGTVANVDVFDNLIYGNTDDGMVIGWGGVEGQSLTISHVYYHSNKIYDNLGDGVVIYGQSNSNIDNIFIYNNFIYDNLGSGIVVSGLTAYLPYSLNEIWLVNNTIHNNGSETVWSSGGINISNQENAIGVMDNIYIHNNIVSSNYTFSIAIWPWGKQPNRITISHNLINNYQNVGGFGETKGTNFVEGDPGFVDSMNRDFHLSYSSKAIDAGIYFEIGILDYDLNIRNDGSYDIGADEYQN